MCNHGYVTTAPLASPCVSRQTPMYAHVSTRVCVYLSDPGSFAASLSDASPSWYHSLPDVFSCPLSLRPFLQSQVLAFSFPHDEAYGHQMLCHLSVSLWPSFVRFVHSRPPCPGFWPLFLSSSLVLRILIYTGPHGLSACFPANLSQCFPLWWAVCLHVLMADPFGLQTKTKSSFLFIVTWFWK